jgi:hypothetical protein
MAIDSPRETKRLLRFALGNTRWRLSHNDDLSVGWMLAAGIIFGPIYANNDVLGINMK